MHSAEQIQMGVGAFATTHWSVVVQAGDSASPEALNGSFQLSFTSTPGTPFAELATTNLALPLSSWSVLGSAVEGPPGQYQFTDLAATNYPARFYSIRSPQESANWPEVGRPHIRRVSHAECLRNPKFG